jgi:hypothetical protein
MTPKEELETYLQELGGCSDGYCYITGKAKGMHTNGGCRCFRDSPHKTQQVIYALRKYIKALEAQTA